MNGRATSALSQRHHALNAMLAEAAMILSPSAFLRQQMSAAGVDPGRIDVSRIGIQLPERPIVRQDANELRIGYMGQIAWHKGIHILIEAVRRLPSASLQVRLYGDDARDESYTAYLRRLIGPDRRISMPGRYPNDRVYEHLAQLDLLVVPSLWPENSPAVILEAHAAQVPVVGSRLGGIPESVVHDRNGWLFEAGHIGELSALLARCVADRGLVRRLRPDPASIRSTDDEAGELIQRYEQLLHGTTPWADG
jgi:glycosyltransferase involved in cell wall biosynthesis